MKSDLRFTGFKTNTEVFGPNRVKPIKERAPRAKKIIDVKIEGELQSDIQSRKRIEKNNKIGFDFTMDIEMTLADDFLQDIMQDKKRSKNHRA